MFSSRNYSFLTHNFSIFDKLKPSWNLSSFFYIYFIKQPLEYLPFIVKTSLLTLYYKWLWAQVVYKLTTVFIDFTNFQIWSFHPSIVIDWPWHRLLVLPNVLPLLLLSSHQSVEEFILSMVSTLEVLLLTLRSRCLKSEHRIATRRNVVMSRPSLPLRNLSWMLEIHPPAWSSLEISHHI